MKFKEKNPTLFLALLFALSAVPGATPATAADVNIVTKYTKPVQAVSSQELSEIYSPEVRDLKKLNAKTFTLRNRERTPSIKKAIVEKVKPAATRACQEAGFKFAGEFYRESTPEADVRIFSSLFVQKNLAWGSQYGLKKGGIVAKVKSPLDEDDDEGNVSTYISKTCNPCGDKDGCLDAIVRCAICAPICCAAQIACCPVSCFQSIERASDKVLPFPALFFNALYCTNYEPAPTEAQPSLSIVVPMKSHTPEPHESSPLVQGLCKPSGSFGRADSSIERQYPQEDSKEMPISLNSPAREIFQDE